MKVQMPASSIIPNLRTVEPIHSRQNDSVQPKINFVDLAPSVEKMSLSPTVKPQDGEKTVKPEVNGIKEEIRIELIEDTDAEEVLNMLKTFFFKDEPMNTYLNLGECKDLEEYALKSLPDKCSFKAVNPRGEIVGVAMNGIIKKPHPNEPFHSYAADCKHPKFKIILSLMEYIDSQFNLFDLYPEINEYLDAKILSVNSNYRGYGIAGKLMERTLQHMREHGITVVSVLCSSHFSARVCEKMNFKNVYQLPFVDYVVNGENPIQPASPHKAVKILVQEVH